MNTKTERIGAALALCLALAAPAMAVQLPKAKPAPMSQQAYAAQKAKIEAQAKADDAYCDGLKAAAKQKDVCHAEAKGRAAALQADLEAQYKPSPDASQKAKEVTAAANYEVAKNKCEAQQPKGAMRDRCLREAKLAREAAIRQAKVEKIQETGGPFHTGSAAKLKAGTS